MSGNTDRSVCVVYMGWNNIKSYLGVFEDESKAKNFLYNHGCVQKEHYIRPSSYTADGGVVYYRPGRTSRCIVTTKKFEKWLKENTKDCPFIYSGGGVDWISLDTIEFNTVVRGFEND